MPIHDGTPRNQRRRVRYVIGEYDVHVRDYVPVLRYGIHATNVAAKRAYLNQRARDYKSGQSYDTCPDEHIRWHFQRSVISYADRDMPQAKILKYPDPA